MALDTRIKRLSVLWKTLPLPTGSLTRADQYHLLWQYVLSPVPIIPSVVIWGITMSDATSVSNEALGELGHRPIQAFTDGTTTSNLCAALFPVARDMTLELHPWNWSVKRIWLARLADAPPFGWTYAYALPPDYIKARGTNMDDQMSAGADWDIELDAMGNRVLLSHQGQVGLVYTARIEDLNLWTPLALQVLVKILAARLAKPITGQNALAELKLKEAYTLLPEARKSDGREGTPRVLRANHGIRLGRQASGGGLPLRYPRSATTD